ncbi:MAG TPA: hypothetical protein VGD41_12090, partial [Pyrinomonadaceae bacterium]
MEKAPDDLPNLPLLIKLLKMTTSSNDGEALMAIRKANEQLKKFGGDWEALLRGKVTMITNPFAGGGINSAPDLSQVRRSSGPPPHPGAPPKPQPAPQPQPQPFHGYRKPQPQPQPRPQAAKTTAAKPQPTPKKAPSFSTVDRVQLD